MITPNAKRVKCVLLGDTNVGKSSLMIRLSKKEKASAAKAKRKHDPNPDRKGDPILVSSIKKGGKRLIKK